MTTITIVVPDDDEDVFERVREALCSCDSWCTDDCNWSAMVRKGMSLEQRVDQIERLLLASNMLPCPEDKCWGAWGHDGPHWTVEGPGLGDTLQW